MDNCLFSLGHLQRLFGDLYNPEEYGFKKVVYLGEELYAMDAVSNSAIREAELDLGLYVPESFEEQLERITFQTLTDRSLL